MTTKYYVDINGMYIGAFGEGTEPPSNGIEVPGAPEDASQMWLNNAWTPPPVGRLTVAKSVVQARVISKGKMGQAYAVLTSNPIYFARWFAPDHPVVYCDDPDAVGLVQALGLDPQEILAPE